jgi:hypothetical protein
MASGEMWIPARGIWQATGEVVRRADHEGEGRILIGNTDWANYRVQVTVKTPATGEAGVMGRCASTDIFYGLAIDQQALTLSRRFNGQSEPLGTWAFPFRPGQAYGLRLTMRGEQIEGGVDTGDGMIARIRVTDDTIPCGCVGFRSVDTSGEFSALAVTP